MNSAYLHGEWATTDVADTSSWSDLYEVNCLGALRMAQACLPSMKEQGGGAIVNVSTMATVNPFPGEAAYAASKGAMLAMTRHMAKDFGQFGIRVNATRMGWIGASQCMIILTDRSKLALIEMPLLEKLQAEYRLELFHLKKIAL